MSLRSLHIFFISVSILLCGFFCAWSIMRYNEGNASFMSLGIGAGIAVLGLLIYLMRFMKKSLAAIIVPLVFSPSFAQACAVCFGEVEPRTKAAFGNAIFFMIGITAVVVTGVTTMVVRTVKQQRKLHEEV